MSKKRKFSNCTDEYLDDRISAWALESPDRDSKTQYRFSSVIEEEFEDLKDAQHVLFACMSDDSERLRSFLLDSIHHDKRWDHFKLQLLIVAVQLGHDNTQVYLEKCLKSDDSIDLNPPGQISILERAIVMKNWKLAKAVMRITKKKLKLVLGTSDETLLCSATMGHQYGEDQTNVIKKLIDCGANCNPPAESTSVEEGYPLNNATNAGSVEVIRRLLKHGASLSEDSPSWKKILNKRQEDFDATEARMEIAFLRASKTKRLRSIKL